MSLLLDLLKDAHDIYKKMESERWFGGTFLRAQKASTIKDLYDKYYKLMTEGKAAADLNTPLAKDILNFTPEVKAPAPTAPGTEPAKQEEPEKHKIEIIFDILHLCAQLQLQNERVSAETISLSDELRTEFETKFTQDDTAKLFILKVQDFMRAMQKDKILRDELKQSQSELKKTQAELKLEQSQRAKHETSSNATIKKLLNDLKKKDDDNELLADKLEDLEESSSNAHAGTHVIYSTSNPKGGISIFGKPPTFNSQNYSAQNNPPHNPPPVRNNFGMGSGRPPYGK